MDEITSYGCENRVQIFDFAPSEYLELCWDVEEELKNLDYSLFLLFSSYLYTLVRKNIYGNDFDSVNANAVEANAIHATARQRCEAMLAAVREGK